MYHVLSLAITIPNPPLQIQKKSKKENQCISFVALSFRTMSCRVNDDIDNAWLINGFLARRNEGYPG
jgi:hypothetical protein